MSGVMRKVFDVNMNALFPPPHTPNIFRSQRLHAFIISIIDVLNEEIVLIYAVYTTAAKCLRFLMCNFLK